MPRVCLVCTSQPEVREAINRELLRGVATRTLARQYSLNHQSLRRHKRNHLAKEMALAIPAAQATISPAVQAAALKSVSHGTDLLLQMDGLVEEAHKIKAQAFREGRLAVALRGITEVCRLIELAAKLRGELASGGVNVAVAVGMNGPLTVAMIDEILRERAELIGDDDPWNRFNHETSDFTRADYEALWTWCRNRRSRVIDAAPEPEQPADGAEAHPSGDRGQNASTEGSNGH